jgi:hypothetical protein
VAKRQLAWMKEKIISDRALDGNNNTTTPLSPLTKTELDLLDTFISQRVDQHMPLQYILGQSNIEKKWNESLHSYLLTLSLLLDSFRHTTVL